MRIISVHVSGQFLTLFSRQCLFSVPLNVFDSSRKKIGIHVPLSRFPGVLDFCLSIRPKRICFDISSGCNSCDVGVLMQSACAFSLQVYILPACYFSIQYQVTHLMSGRYVNLFDGFDLI